MFFKISFGLAIMSAAIILTGGSLASLPPPPPDRLFSKDDYHAVETGHYNRQVFPKCSDRQAWNRVPPTIAAELLKRADAVVNAPLEELSFYDYLPCDTASERRKYENKYFERRTNLAILAAACCVSGDVKRYLPKLIDYLWAVAAEPYWCVYIHGTWLPNDIMVADIVEEKVDLFAAATGAEIAIIINILGDELSAVSPGMVEKIREITLRKTVLSVLETDRDHLHWWLKVDEPRINNWSAWCSSNVLLTAICLERDTRRLARLIRKLNPNIARYIDSFPEDGFCVEGVDYWGVGAGNLFNYLSLLEHLRPNCESALFATSKMKAVAEFPCRAMITPDSAASFSDADTKVKFDLDLMRRFGQRVGSRRLTAFAMTHAAKQSPAEKLNSQWGQLSRSLFETLLAANAPTKQDPTVSETTPCDWFPKRFCIFRTSDQFAATLLGGSNGESHNHNDLGHFTVYCNQMPVVIDAGTMNYGNKNFTPQRYELWYTGAQGHNAPEINGVLQQEGAQYHAELDAPSRDGDTQTVTVDLGKAYPQNAGIKTFTRKISISPRGLEVTDAIIAVPAVQKVVIRLYSPLPAVLNGTSVSFGKLARLNCNDITPTKITEISVDKKMAYNYAAKLYCVELTGNRGNYKLHFSRLPADTATK